MQKIINPQRVKVVLVAGALLLGGCVAPAKKVAPPPAPAPVCAQGEAMTQTTLYFGLTRPGGAPITAAEWQAFVDNDVTPRFKEGLSVFDAKGQWLNRDGKVTREDSKALMLIHSVGKESNERIDALRTIYKQRFAQESVMWVDAPVCVAF